jgi:hypothetical protein
MGTAISPAVRSERDRIAETRLDIKELTATWTQRHRLRRGTAEYVAAIEAEERLVVRIWRRLLADGTTATRTPIKD